MMRSSSPTTRSTRRQPRSTSSRGSAATGAPSISRPATVGFRDTQQQAADEHEDGLNERDREPVQDRGPERDRFGGDREHQPVHRRLANASPEGAKTARTATIAPTAATPPRYGIVETDGSPPPTAA